MSHDMHAMISVFFFLFCFQNVQLLTYDAVIINALNCEAIFVRSFKDFANLSWFCAFKTSVTVGHEMAKYIKTPRYLMLTDFKVTAATTELCQMGRFQLSGPLCHSHKKSANNDNCIQLSDTWQLHACNCGTNSWNYNAHPKNPSNFSTSIFNTQEDNNNLVILWAI